MQSSHLAAGGAALIVAAAFAATAMSQTVPAAAPSSPQPAGITGNVDHGRYIVQDIAMCAQCHSPRDDHGDIIESQEFFGAPIPVRPPWANDWAILAPRNRGLPGYDDAQAMRLLTEGAIGRDGRQLRPPMPRFRMTRQDAADVIAYMRSLR
jgi:mono/diheme cytochrome c family protein